MGFFSLFQSRDKKPVLMSFILQRDECSRLLGEFSEKHLSNASRLIIIWQNGTDDINVQSTEGLSVIEAAGLCIKAGHVIAGEHGA